MTKYINQDHVNAGLLALLAAILCVMAGALAMSPLTKLSALCWHGSAVAGAFSIGLLADHCLFCQGDIDLADFGQLRRVIVILIAQLAMLVLSWGGV